jgi:hypothetical protein
LPATSPHLGQSAASYSVNAATHCEQAKGRPSVCRIALISRSTADFDWRVRGEPDVVFSSPASGSLGVNSSTTVTVTLPCLRQPVTVIVKDATRSVSTRSTVPAVKFC